MGIASHSDDLSFQAVQGGTSPTSQIVNVSKSNNHTVSWSGTDNAAWLSISPTSGSITNSAQISVSVNPAGLAAGTYTATVTITAAHGGSISVPVTLTVTAASVPPAIAATPTSLSFSAQQGGGNPAAQTVSISNTGGGTLSWSASDNAAWLTLSPASGTGNGAVTLSATTGTLTAGSYSGTVTLSATGATPVTVPVSFTVTAAPVPPAIGASPTSLTFSAIQGGSGPPNQTLYVQNAGGGILNATLTTNAPWLGVSPTSTVGNVSVDVYVNIVGLTAGTYKATITGTATGAATSVTVPVTFTVTAASASIAVSPTSLSFTATQGAANPANQSV